MRTSVGKKQKQTRSEEQDNKRVKNNSNCYPNDWEQKKCENI